MGKTIYLYEMPSGFYVGTYDACEDPENPEKVTWPGWGTEIKPPTEMDEKHVGMFKDGAWNLVNNLGVGSLIDDTGLFVEPYIFQLGEDATPTHIPAFPKKDAFVKAKWSEAEWVEGATQTEIDADTKVKQIADLKAQLVDLDTKLPRSTEDLITAMNVSVDILPQAMQDYLKQKQSLRSQLQGLIGTSD